MRHSTFLAISTLCDIQNARSFFKVAALLAGTAVSLIACTEQPAPTYQGYAEGEFVLVAAPYAGDLETLSVHRGQQVEAGALLFTLERANEQAARDEAEERLKSAEANLANLQAAKRTPELNALLAQVAQAQAALELSTSQLRKQERLFASGFISKEQLDEARASHKRDIAGLSEAQAQLHTASLSIGRDAEIQAASAEVEAARAALAQSEWRLAQKTAEAPTGALVQDTYYSQGEWVPAGSPIVSLLPPGNIKVRFFVPETLVGSLKVGQSVSIACDGCAAPISAIISYISAQPEYTPPVIYSTESRAKLVFLLEAKPRVEDAIKLHPGQPVDVTLQQPS